MLNPPNDPIFRRLMRQLLFFIFEPKRMRLSQKKNINVVFYTREIEEKVPPIPPRCNWWKTKAVGKLPYTHRRVAFFWKWDDGTGVVTFKHQWIGNDFRIHQ